MAEPIRETLTIEEPTHLPDRIKFKAGGRYYTYWFPKQKYWTADDQNFMVTIMHGATINFDVIEVPNPKSQHPYRNVYRPNTYVPAGTSKPVNAPTPTQVPSTPYNATQATTTPPAAIPDNMSDKDKKIRWMNSLNNACHAITPTIDKKSTPAEIVTKIGELAIRLYYLEPEDVIVDDKKGKTDGLVTVEQMKKLHAFALENYGLGHEPVRIVCGELLGKSLVSVKDMTQQEAHKVLDIMEHDPEEVERAKTAKLSTIKNQSIGEEQPPDDEGLPF